MKEKRGKIKENDEEEQFGEREGREGRKRREKGEREC